MLSTKLCGILAHAIHKILTYKYKQSYVGMRICKCLVRDYDTGIYALYVYTNINMYLCADD